jgi:uncharacterized protein
LLKIMRRKDKEITDKAQIESILNEAEICRIAMCSDDIPYIVPVNFAYKNDFIYFHSFPSGKKIDIIKKNSSVCFEAEIKSEIVKSANACSWGMKFMSVIGSGIAEIIADEIQKQEALNIIMGKYSGISEWEFTDSMGKISVIKIKIKEMTGKKSGY